MSETKPTLLIIEDDHDVAEMLNAYFRVHGYEVLTADWGEDGVETAQTTIPDLIILDIRLPDMDGFEVAERLRASRRTARIPILFLTEKRQRVDRIKGLSLGADDYITKPFDIQELRLRVRNALRRATHGPMTNTITHLPEGTPVDERLSAWVENPGEQVLMVVHIDNLDRFREARGFVASDDALRAICMVIEGALEEVEQTSDFIGHLAPTDILLVTPATRAADLKEGLQKRLAHSIDLFYPVHLRERGEPIPDRLAVRIGLLSPDPSLADVSEVKAQLVATVA